MESYPFDWMWTNIDFILKTLESDFLEFTEVEKLNAVWEPNQFHTYILNNGCTGGQTRICSALSLHDADHKNRQE